MQICTTSAFNNSALYNVCRTDQAHLKPKGHKTARSPANRAQAQRPASSRRDLQTAMCKTVRALQIAGQKLFEKNQKLKEYERAKALEFEAREKALAERERRLGYTYTAHNVRPHARSDDVFDYQAPGDSNDVVFVIRYAV